MLVLVRIRKSLILQKPIIPQALIVTPNCYETEILSGLTIDSLEQLQQAAIAIQRNSGAKVVLAKGGALSVTEQSIDV